MEPSLIRSTKLCFVKFKLNEFLIKFLLPFSCHYFCLVYPFSNFYSDTLKNLFFLTKK